MKRELTQNQRWITVKCGDGLIRRLDLLAERAGLNRSEAVRLLIARATLEDFPPSLVAGAVDRRIAKTLQ